MKKRAFIIGTISMAFILFCMPKMLKSQDVVNGLTKAEITEIIDKHNHYRTNAGIPLLEWSDELAEYAYKWGKQLVKTNSNLKHRPSSGKWKRIYGENLFKGTTSYHKASDAVTSWASEKIYFTKTNWEKAGHYSQIVWRNTTKVGCAKVEHKGSIIVICNYNPPGNYTGQKAY